MVDAHTAIPCNLDISFDPSKDAINQGKHKLPLSFGGLVPTNSHGEVEDRRYDYGERRMKAFAPIEGLWFQCTYTMRGTVAHVINVHGVSEKEMRQWLKKSE